MAIKSPADVSLAIDGGTPVRGSGESAAASLSPLRTGTAPTTTYVRCWMAVLQATFSAGSRMRLPRLPARSIASPLRTARLRSTPSMPDWESGPGMKSP